MLCIETKPDNTEVNVSVTTLHTLACCRVNSHITQTTLPGIAKTRLCSFGINATDETARPLAQTPVQQLLVVLPYYTPCIPLSIIRHNSQVIKIGSAGCTDRYSCITLHQPLQWTCVLSLSLSLSSIANVNFALFTSFTMNAYMYDLLHHMPIQCKWICTCIQTVSSAHLVGIMPNKLGASPLNRAWKPSV